MGAEVGLVFSALSAVGKVVSASQQQSAQKKAAKEQKKARQIQAAKAEASASRQRKQQLSELRQRRAATLTQTQGAGVGGSSAELGALGSVTSQAAGNIGFLDTQLAASRGANTRLESAAGFQEQAARAGGISQGFGQVFSAFGGTETLGQGVNMLREGIGV